jgi:hypothetical protein
VRWYAETSELFGPDSAEADFAADCLKAHEDFRLWAEGWLTRRWLRRTARLAIDW